jgi:hypothetical protein
LTQFSIKTNEFLNTNKTIYEVVMLADKYGNLAGGTGGTSVDSFGRLRVGEPYTLFESFHRYGLANSKWSYVTTGSGNVSFSSNEGCVLMTVGTGSTDSILFETKKIFPYQPGKSLLIMMTTTFDAPTANLNQRLGYYSSNNGVYLEQSNSEAFFVLRTIKTGTVVNNKVTKNDWNVDRFDGNGPSGITLDLTKSQIFWTDLEWLGVGSVRCGFVINGQMHIGHIFHHANIDTSTYMQTACLPLRYEMFNTGTTSKSSTMRKICSTVLSEGGYNQIALSRSASTPITGKNLINQALNPMVSIRLKSSRLDAVVIPSMVDFYGLQSNAFKYFIVRNATSLGNVSWTSTDSDSSVEYDIFANTITGGEIVHQGIFRGQAASQTISLVDNFNHTLQLTRTLNQSNGDIFTIAVEPTTQNDDAIVALSWQEHTL